MNAAANFTLYVSYHSYGQYILYPWGYDKVVPEDYEDLDAAGNAAATVSLTICTITINRKNSIVQRVVICIPNIAGYCKDRRVTIQSGSIEYCPVSCSRSFR